MSFATIRKAEAPPRGLARQLALNHHDPPAAGRVRGRRAWQSTTRRSAPSIRTRIARANLAQLLLASGNQGEALALGEAALAAHEKLLGPDHPWIKHSASITADALDALGRPEEAKALRARCQTASGRI